MITPSKPARTGTMRSVMAVTGASLSMMPVEWIATNLELIGFD
jgi:hypothetical protein